MATILLPHVPRQDYYSYYSSPSSPDQGSKPLEKSNAIILFSVVGIILFVFLIFFLCIGKCQWQNHRLRRKLEALAKLRESDPAQADYTLELELRSWNNVEGMELQLTEMNLGMVGYEGGGFEGSVERWRQEVANWGEQRMNGFLVGAAREEIFEPRRDSGLMDNEIVCMEGQGVDEVEVADSVSQRAAKKKQENEERK